MLGGGIAWAGQQMLGLADLLFPPACPICLRPLSLSTEASSFCAFCTAEIAPLPAGRCSLCALPFVASTSSSHYCADCSRKLPAYSSVHAAGLYTDALKQALQRFKYSGAVDLDKPLADLLFTQIPSNICCDVIVPVPLHVSRLRTRGYNQSLLLARVLAHNLHFLLEPAVLQRTVATHSQQGLDARQRARNLSNTFVCTRRMDRCRVLLVDDVMTTGATVSACTQALIEAGASRVDIAVIARAPRH